jgi:DNA-binding transcriptional ArsR family regulator
VGHATADGDPAPAASDVPTDDQAGVAAAMFSMLADPTRLKLLWLLGSEELDVTTLAARARTSPTVASQHLAKLRLGGFVVQRTSGRRRLYSADGSHLRALIREALYRADHEVTGVPDHG